MSAESQPVGADTSGQRHQAHERQHGDALARSGFADDTEDFTLFKLETDLVDRAERIRGYYASSDDGFPAGLLRDLRQLEREKS